MLTANKLKQNGINSKYKSLNLCELLVGSAKRKECLNSGKIPSVSSAVRDLKRTVQQVEGGNFPAKLDCSQITKVKVKTGSSPRQIND